MGAILFIKSGLQYTNRRQMKIFNIKPCKDCGPLPISHFQNWVDDLLYLLFPQKLFKFLPSKSLHYFSNLLDKILIKSKFLSPKSEFSRHLISLRSTVFMEEAKKYGINFCALQSPFRYTNYFLMELGGKTFSFEGLPRAEFLGNPVSQIIDDKFLVKSHLKKFNFPIAEGKSFLWFQKNRAYKWAIKNLGFPLVVKPRLGSMSQHVTVNIRDSNSLKSAIKKAISYSPAFIIEKFIPKTNIYRATVIDFEFVACLQRVPAHIVGDGVHTIEELIEIKNQDPRRGNPRQKDTTLYKLAVNDDMEKMLSNKGYNFNSVPKKREIVYLQEKIILDLGADLIEMTSKIHPDNLQLFRDVAKLFDVRLVGIDFLAKNISISYKNQTCAIIELNSLPYIDMHHFPTKGKPVNISTELVKMVLKYYR